MNAIPNKSSSTKNPVCWCGHKDLQPFSPEYELCTECSTLVSRVGLTAEEIAVQDDSQDFYGKDYWLNHQVKDLGNPDIFQRARTDLPERCLYWLRSLLNYQLPPAKVLEIGCAHGGFVALARSVGYDAVGLEMSPWVVQFAKDTFHIPMLQGPIEDQHLSKQSFDAIVLNDVVEHLVDPLATLGLCGSLLRPAGILVVQMPLYPENVTYEDLQARTDPFLQHMVGKADQHLNLFSPRSAKKLFARIGFEAVESIPAIFGYDQYLFASRQTLKRQDREAQAAALTATSSGRMGLALIDLMTQYDALKADHAERLKTIQSHYAGWLACEADRLAARSELEQLRDVVARLPHRMLARILKRLPARVYRSLKRLARAG
jgi:SAM-dependent methyltransferase